MRWPKNTQLAYDIWGLLAQNLMFWKYLQSLQLLHGSAFPSSLYELSENLAIPYNWDLNSSLFQKLGVSDWVSGLLGEYPRSRGAHTPVLEPYLVHLMNPGLRLLFCPVWAYTTPFYPFLFGFVF